MKQFFPIMLAVAVCAACSSRPEHTPEVVESFPPEIHHSSSGLAAQTLAPGDCGLFLWNKTNSQTFVFFQRAGEAVARYFDGAEVELANTSIDGVLFGEFYTMTKWTAPDGGSVVLSIVPGEEIDGGQRIPSGVISVVNADGWEIKTPVAGVTACKTD